MEVIYYFSPVIDIVLAVIAAIVSLLLMIHFFERMVGITPEDCKSMSPPRDWRKNKGGE